MSAETRCESCLVFVPASSVVDVTEFHVWPVTLVCEECVTVLEDEPVCMEPECRYCRSFCFKCLG